MTRLDPIDNETLLEVSELKVHFPVRADGGTRELLRAVDDVSFTVAKGETLGLVGESGSGKSTIARSVVGVEQPTAGTVALNGRDLAALSRTEMRAARATVQMVFQDPYASLNRRHTIARAVVEPLDNLTALPSQERRQRVLEMLERVGLDKSFRDRYPHTLSGGQRQRVAIARALVVSPALVVCDEPVSALDVSVQAQIINLLADLQAERGLAYLFIAHDLAIVRQIAHRVAVMYCGKLVEIGAADQVYARPLHPYTRALLAAAPIPDARVERARRHVVARGEPASPLRPPSGCRFRTRCPWAQAKCSEVEPPLREADGQKVACHYYEEIAQGSPPTALGITPDRTPA